MYSNITIRYSLTLLEITRIKNFREVINSILIVFNKKKDPGQLPPISENEEYPTDEDSPAFSFFENKIVLDQKVRQTEGNPIIELTDFIYEMIFPKDGMQVTYDHLNRVVEKMVTPVFNNGIGYEMLKFNQFLSTYTSLSKDFADTKVIAYRNDNVKFYNDLIRNFIYNNPEETIIDGELIYMNDTFSLDRKTNFYNSDEYVITKVDKMTHHEGVECYQSHVDRTGHSHLSASQNCFMFIPTVEGKKEIDRLLIYFNREIEAQPFKSVQRNIAYSKKYKFLDKFANVSYGYCYTCYKSQGSTFKNVFVDVNDILSVNITPKRKLQALYTAITRASHSVYFLN